MKIQGKAAWAYLNKPKEEGIVKSKKTGKPNGKKIQPKYTILLVLEPKLGNKLLKAGYNVKKAKEDISGIEGSKGKPTLEISTNAFFENEPMPKPEVVDSKVEPFTGRVGNGSTVNVVFFSYEYEDDDGNTKYAAKLRKVQILDLVSYDNLESFEEEEGFESTTKVSAVAGTDSFEDESDDDLDF